MPNNRTPPLTLGYCAYHERLMTDRYIRRRRCLYQMCKHFWWFDLVDGITLPLMPRRREAAVCDEKDEPPHYRTVTAA